VGGAIDAIVEAARQVAPHEAFASRLALVAQWLSEDAPRSPREVREQLGCGMAAAESCPAALYLACVYMKGDFEALIEHAGRCGGDTDTVGAMSGAIWGAARGVDALPEAWLVKLEDAAQIREVAAALCEEVV
jgi:poly(ADP-ribose) glycohydrolase ARH3